MTRFAKRSVSGPQKKPLDATEWKDMKSSEKKKEKNKNEKSNTEDKSLLKLKKTEVSGTSKKFKKDKLKKGGKFNKSNKVQYPKRVCFRCQQPGHKMTDCPLQGDQEGENNLFELKERWKKEKRGDWRRQKRQKEKDAKMVKILYLCL